MPKYNPEKRRLAREFSVQAIYQWQLAGHTALEIEKQFIEEYDIDAADKDYFVRLLQGVVDESEKIDSTLIPVLDRDLYALNPVELAILRLSVYELLFCLDVPYRVVINEALELTKKFGAIEGYKYVNGVLDKIAQKNRQTKIKQ